MSVIEHRPRSGTRGYNLVALFAIGAVVIGFGGYIYERPSDGIGYMIGSAIACLAIGRAMATPFTGGSRRWMRGATGLTLSLALLVSLNIGKVMMTRDAYQFRDLLANAAGPFDLMAKLEAAPGNKLAAITKIAVDAAKGTIDEISAAAAKLAPAELDAPIDVASASTEDLRRLHQAAIIAESNARMAEAQVEVLFARERARISEGVRSGEYGVEITKPLMDGIDNRHRDYVPYFKSLFDLKAQQFRSEVNMFAILVRESGRFKRAPSGQILFANSAAIGPFNEAVQSLSSISSKLEAHVKEGEALDARYQQGFEKAIKRR
ncbi:hypothetical protein [Azospirillum picis]|uniref:Uncharacterized protein n=1 Tax=Azospirillum picis TaxID=488438 RepID=A0ABU0MQA4_9PROT|nr:hypothetical protein [Azospirillum picis]MBP2301536.1 hypothetical protein [Azospirillum picis]MDQ0535368.1 hypothetical protein [Azospirillum picis]